MATAMAALIALILGRKARAAGRFDVLRAASERAMPVAGRYQVNDTSREMIYSHIGYNPDTQTWLYKDCFIQDGEIFFTEGETKGAVWDEQTRADIGAKLSQLMRSPDERP